ncbi:MBL fold metallo-hydrolase [Nocardioides hungaricus]
MSLNVEILDTAELGDRSYVVDNGELALVVDPQRDVDRVERVLEERGLTCAAVLETHIHNDYVTGGLTLARRLGADYVVGADDPVRFSRRPVRGGDLLDVGSLQVEVIATPGHTATHLAYLVRTDGEDPALFSGGSLLYGSVGRTDLLGRDRTDELTRAQHRSARLLGDLPGPTRLYPTHGFGSFCSSGAATQSDRSTIAQERVHNDALVETDEDAFVSRLVANLTAYPAYYARMSGRNLAGPEPADLSVPELAGPDEIRARIAAGDWVVDLRHRTAYAAGHLSGTVGIELGSQFSTYLGWLMPWGAPLTLVGESVEQVREAQRQLVRIGIERPDAAAVGPVATLAGDEALGSYPRATFTELAALDPGRRAGLTVLDVRRDDERAAGAIPGTLHIPLHSLEQRMSELPDQTLWVHCASGFRASIAVSLLARAGRDVVLVDDDFSRSALLSPT